MSCPTCDHSMQSCGEGLFWCPRCGSVRHRGSVYVPNLVHHVRELHSTITQDHGFSNWDIETWIRLGIADSIDLPGQRLRERPSLIDSQKEQSCHITSISVNGVNIGFAWCPPGTFLMGSPSSEESRSDDEIQHRVTLTHGFYLGIHAVTQAQWQAVMGNNPSHFKGDDLPVEQVSWDDCQAFCAKLSQLTGKRFRLPTEAEWEYACRAGTTTPFYFGDTISTDHANYNGNYTYGRGKKGVYRQQTTPVGSFPANAWGLFDMHGNVWEWCEDWYGAYPKKDIKDQENINIREAHVLRGGAFFTQASAVRSSYRNNKGPANRYIYLGFRVVFCLD